MAFYTQGILYCMYIYIGTVQVYIALLKFYIYIYGLLKALRATSHGRNVSGSKIKVASVSSSLARK